MAHRIGGGPELDDKASVSRQRSMSSIVLPMVV
jgi:hypothetical protein